MDCWARLRRDQRRVAERLAENLEAGRASVLAANTGWGKTLTVLCPTLTRAAETGARVWYFVHRRDQIAVPVVKHLLEFFPDVNYSFLYSKLDTCPMVSGSASILELEEICEPGRCPYRPAPPEAVDLRGFGTDIFGVVKHLASSGFCPYYTLRSLIRDSDIVVLHHSYLFVPEWRRGLGVDFANDIIIVDEFHGVEDVLDIYSVRVDMPLLRKAKREAEKHGARLLAETADAVAKLLKRYRRYDVILRREHLGFRDPAKLREEVEKIIEDLRARRKRVKRLSLATVRLAAFADAVWGRGYDVFVEGEAFVARPVDPAAIIGPVIDGARQIILMSATPPTREYMRLVWGVGRDDLDVIRVARRWGYGAAFRVDWVTTKYTDRSEDMWRRYAYLIDMLLEAVPGVHLYVFPSYQVLVAVYGYVRRRDEVFAENQSGARITDVYRAVEEGKRAVFAVARGKLVEGVELKRGGESMVKLVCLCGAPYPEPDKRFERLVELVSRRTGVSGEEARRVVLYNAAVTASIQALGRAVRSPSDYAFYVLADKRFAGRLLRDIAATGLFNYRRTRYIPLPANGRGGGG